MPNPQSQLQYLLDLVNQELATLDAERETLTNEFLSTGSWRTRDVNYGETLALEKMRGRLEATVDERHPESNPQQTVTVLRRQLASLSRYIEALEKQLEPSVVTEIREAALLRNNHAA